MWDYVTTMKRRKTWRRRRRRENIRTLKGKLRVKEGMKEYKEVKEAVKH